MSTKMTVRTANTIDSMSADVAVLDQNVKLPVWTNNRTLEIPAVVHHYPLDLSGISARVNDLLATHNAQELKEMANLYVTNMLANEDQLKKTQNRLENLTNKLAKMERREALIDQHKPLNKTAPKAKSYKELTAIKLTKEQRELEKEALEVKKLEEQLIKAKAEKEAKERRARFEQLEVARKAKQEAKKNGVRTLSPVEQKRLEERKEAKRLAEEQVEKGAQLIRTKLENDAKLEEMAAKRRLQKQVSQQQLEEQKKLIGLKAQKERLLKQLGELSL